MIEPELFDTVELLVDLPEPNLRAGKRGAIVHVHSDDMFEVEFVTEEGETEALYPLSKGQIIVVWRARTEKRVPLEDQIAQIILRLSQKSRSSVRYSNLL
jgi:hypothetical protein